MFLLILILLFLIVGIVVSQLNNQLIDFNFLGIIMHDFPLSLLLMIDFLIGIGLTYLSSLIKNLNLRNSLIRERRTIEILSKRELMLKNKIKNLENYIDQNDLEKK